MQREVAMREVSALAGCFYPDFAWLSDCCRKYGIESLSFFWDSTGTLDQVAVSRFPLRCATVNRIPQ